MRRGRRMFFKKKKEENINNLLTAMELKLHCSIILQAASERRRVRNLPQEPRLRNVNLRYIINLEKMGFCNILLRMSPLKIKVLLSSV